MTTLARFLDGRMIDPDRVAKRTGMGKTRMRQLIRSKHCCPMINEVKLIALAISVPPVELFEYICKDVRLVNPGYESPFD